MEIITYIGAKVVKAEPYSKEQFDHYKLHNAHSEESNWSTITPGYKVYYEDGYVSWSPKDVFDKFYTNIDLFSGKREDRLKEIIKANPSISDDVIRQIFQEGMKYMGLCFLKNKIDSSNGS